MRLNVRIHKRPPEDVLTIAHRGGVVGHGTHDDSRSAIEAAIVRGYDMVELDVMSTIDHYPILVHGAWEVFEEGRPEPTRVVTFHDKTLAQVKKERHPVNGEPVLTLAAGLEICRGHLGVMLDFKMPGGHPVFYERVAEALDEFDFPGKTMTISKEVLGVRDCLAGKSLFAIGPDEIDPLAAQWALSPDYFGFGIPDLQPGDGTAESTPDGGLSEEDVAMFHQFGLAVVIAINTFRYYERYHDAAETHVERARRDIERFRAAGADGFQIDSVYDHFLFG